jgi:hypothetical protein
MNQYSKAKKKKAVINYLVRGKLSLKREEEIITFPDKQKLREFVDTEFALEKCSKEFEG